MSEYSVTIEETDTFRVRIVLMSDSYDMNPREDRDGIVTGVATLPTTRYGGIADPAGTLADQWARLTTERYRDRDAVAIFERYVRLCGGVAVFDSPNDGPSAVWYVLPETMRAVGFTDAEITPERMREALDAERREYRAWAEGDVWGVVTETRATWHKEGTDETRDEWEEDESVWGFIGQEYAEQEARDTATMMRHPEHRFTAVADDSRLVTVTDGEGNVVAERIPFLDAAKQYGNRGIYPAPTD